MGRAGKKSRAVRWLRGLSAALSFSAWAASAAVHAQAQPACTPRDLQRLAPRGVTVLAAKTVAASGKLLAHCLVDANVATPGNVVDFRLGLPTRWNHKLLFIGVGGFAGSMGRLDLGLERGYATVTTDTGHRGSSGTDASWALDHRPEELDYGHRGTHASAVASRQLTRA